VTKIELAPGVVYEEHLYYDPDGKPVRAYMITVAPGAATIATSLPKDENQIGRLSNMLNQVKDAASNGKNVLAGINADFFDIENGTDQMLGLCVKDGVLLHDVSGRPWFGVTKNGTPVIGEDYVYDSHVGNLMTAVGGSNIVLKDDKPFHISVDHDFGYTRHPRSAVGYKPDGSIVLLVVDGRQAQVSNGAALADLADILAMQGCSNGLNLDGGGSSTFVLKGEDGSYSITNSPSDPYPRPVADGLIVILPDNKD
jgi:exopolysaccharide biosynthesis protein